MYRINLDVINKIIYIELHGTMTLDEIDAYNNELNDLVGKFELRQYSMLVLARRLDPLSQDNLPAFQQVIETALIWANKIAIIHGNRTITKMQFKRLESEARKITNSDTQVMRFQIMKEAMNYLNRI